MNNLPVIVGTIVVYMGVCLVLGFVAYRRTTNLADFILGGRSLGSWVTAFSAQASDMSGWLLMGLPGLAYLAGFDAAWLAAGLIVGTWLNWRFIAAPLRTRTEQLGDSLTLPDYFERRFDDRSRVLRTITALLILVFFTFYASSGFVATGRLFEALFGMHYHDAMFWGSFVMLAYTFFGGFLAVSWSDVLQGTLMFFALILVAAMGVGLAGGFGDMIATLEAREPALLDPFLGSGGEALGAIGIASLLAWGLGYPGQPHILARFMAIRSVEEMPTARRVAMVWVIVVLLAAIVVGLAGAALISPPLTGPDTEKVFIQLSTTHLHPVLAGLCLAGILAAIMSTASAQLLVASSAFAQDFYKGLFRSNPGRAELLWVGRGAVLGIALLAYLLALNPENKVLDLVAWAWAGFGAAFGPAIVLSLYWPRMTRNGALAGMLVGGATVILWKQGSGGIFALYEMVPGVVLSGLAIWIVSSIGGRARA
jgi:sodium/proline symporter